MAKTSDSDPNALKQKSFPALGPQGFHRLAYTEWGDPRNPHVVICAHGLTRNSRDFDFLALALAGDFRVICLDMAGRGKSSGWPSRPITAIPFTSRTRRRWWPG